MASSNDVDTIVKRYLPTVNSAVVYAASNNGDRQLLLSSWDKDRFLPNGGHSVFDVASLSKPITAIAFMKAVEQRKVSLNTSVCKQFRKLCANDRSSITPAMLLRHRSGLAPVNGVSDLRPGDARFNWANINRRRIWAKPDTKFVYSDVGFMALAWILELVYQRPLDRVVQDLVFNPLKMNSCYYGKKGTPVATTRGRDGLVHDPRARKLRGVAGHAGVFCNAVDYAKAFKMLLKQGMGPDGKRFLRAQTVKRMLTPDRFGRGLGVDLTSRYSPSVRGPYFKKGVSFGHTGYTGTSVWADPSSGRLLIIFTNRVYSDDSRESKRAVSRLRKALATHFGRAN